MCARVCVIVTSGCSGCSAGRWKEEWSGGRVTGHQEKIKETREWNPNGEPYRTHTRATSRARYTRAQVTHTHTHTQTRTQSQLSGSNTLRCLKMTVLMLSSQSKCNYVSASASVSRDSKLDLLCVRRTATLYSADSQAVGSLEKYYLVNLSTSVPQRSRRYMCSIDYIFLLHNNTDVITSQLLCFSLFSVCVHLSVSS